MEVPKHIKNALEILSNSSLSSTEIANKARYMLDEIQGKDKVCLLKKSLYGLRQAGRCWNDKLTKTLQEFGLKKSSNDPCIFYKGRDQQLILVAAYVDNIIIASQDYSKIDSLKKFLSRNFKVKDLGRMHYCLGIKFSQENGSVKMKQAGYIRDILTRFGMSDANNVTTPLDPSIKLRPCSKELKPYENYRYKELTGALMYLATSTRPDIAHAVSYLSQFNSCYDVTHWTAAKRVLRYLKGTIDIGLEYKRTQKPLEGYVDADWAGCSLDRRSYTGYTFLLSGCPISWESRKQRTTALSSTESEYMALAEAAKQATYLKRFLEEISTSVKLPIRVLCDNNGACKLAENPVFHN